MPIPLMLYQFHTESQKAKSEETLQRRTIKWQKKQKYDALYHHTLPNNPTICNNTHNNDKVPTSYQ